jgi:hypothetical protein
MAKPIQHKTEYAHLPATAAGALHLGTMYYFTGKPCRKGHVGLRYASSANCVTCIEERRNFRIDTSKHRFSERNINLAINAMANGETVYQSETPCPKGHKVRFTGTNNCVECGKQVMRARREKSKWARIKKLYGLNFDDVDLMKRNQNNQCQICCISLTDKNTHIDHCHDSGKVRALLCSRCNQALGLIDESLERVENIRAYLIGHGKC